MISTGPSGSKAFFMSNLWSGSSSSLSTSSRSFQHKPLKSASEESLHLDLLANSTAYGTKEPEKNNKLGELPGRKVTLMRRRYKSQNDADTVSELEFELTNEQVDNCVVYDEETNGEQDDEFTKSSGRTKCGPARKTTKLRKPNKTKQQDLLTSILDDTDDIDQIEYFDDDEIYSKTTMPANVIQTEKSNDQASPKNESVAIELLRMLSIKSANTWWRWNSKDAIVRAKDSPDQTDLVLGGNRDEKSDELIEIEMNPMGTPSSSNANESTMAKLKTLAKLNAQKKQMERFMSYRDEPNDEDNGIVNQCCDTEIYTVHDSRETLRSIAARFQTTPAEIKSLNRLTHDYVFIGQMLLVPTIVPQSKLVEITENN